MFRSNIDIPLAIFTIGQYALVLFAGFLMYTGLFALIRDQKKIKHLNVDGEIDYWSKRVKLLEIKQKYEELKEQTNDLDDELENIASIEQEINDAEEVDIPTLSELIERDESEFLKHSDQPTPPEPPHVVISAQLPKPKKHWFFKVKGEKKHGRHD